MPNHKPSMAYTGLTILVREEADETTRIHRSAWQCRRMAVRKRVDGHSVR